MVLQHLAKFFRERLGQDLIEYTLLLAFIALGAIGLLSQTGSSISGLWTSANSTIARGTGSAPRAGGSDGGGDQGGGDSGSDGH